MEEEEDVLFSEVQVMRDGDDVWHCGLVDEFHPERGYHIQYFDGEDDWIVNIHDEFVRIDKSGGGKASKRASQSKPVDDDDVLMMGGDNADFDFFNQDEEELAIIPAKAADKKKTSPRLSAQLSPRLSATNNASSTINSNTLKSTRFLDTKQEFDSSPVSTQYHRNRENTLMTAMDDLDAAVLAPTATTKQKEHYLDEYQTKNRDILSSQLTYLHPRGVLFVGSIVNVKLPRLPDGNSTDGRILFRVLFIEGGNQPAMFRCKTPIFTSTSVPASLPTEDNDADGDEMTVTWSEDTFRFDMVMPSVDDEDNNAKAFVIQGEVMISIYRARTNGGNDLLGQLAVDLKTFRSRGTVECFAPGSEGRSMNGVYPLILPGSKDSVVGEMEVQFNIAWKDNAADPPVQSALKAGKIAPNTSTKSVSMSRNGSKTGSKDNASRPQSAGPRARPTSSSAIEKPNHNNHVNGREPRKIVSKLQRKMKEDERRIKRENELLQQKIAKHTTPASATTTASQQPGPVAAYGAVPAAQMKQQQQQQAYQEPINPAIEKHTNTWQTLAAAHEQLKKALRDDENSLKDMKSKLSNLNTNIARQEAGIDRAKMVSNIQLHSRHSSQSHGQDSARQSITSLQPSNAASTTVFQLGKLENVADGQYHQVKEEYEVLQRMRRALIERRRQAELARNQSLSQATAVQQKMAVATKRLLHFAAEFPSLLPGGEGDEQAQADSKQNPQRSERKLQDDDDNELSLSLLDSLRSVTAEQASVTTLQEDNHELMQLFSARAELEAILQHLDKQVMSVKKDIDTTLDQKQALLVELQETKEHQDELQRRRSFVTLMKGLELKLRREQRMRILSDGVRDIELQMVRLKMLAVERQQLGIIAESNRPAAATAIANGAYHNDSRHLAIEDNRHDEEQQQQQVDGERHAKTAHAKLAEQDLQDLYDIVD